MVTKPTTDETNDAPADLELARLRAAFDRGDYREVRRGTEALALANSQDEAVRKVARALRARTEADPFAKLALVLTAVLLVWLTLYWEKHDGKRNVEPDRPSSAEPR